MVGLSPLGRGTAGEGNDAFDRNKQLLGRLGAGQIPQNDGMAKGAKSMQHIFRRSARLVRGNVGDKHGHGLVVLVVHEWTAKHGRAGEAGYLYALSLVDQPWESSGVGIRRLLDCIRKVGGAASLACAHASHDFFEKIHCSRVQGLVVGRERVPSQAIPISGKQNKGGPVCRGSGLDCRRQHNKWLVKRAWACCASTSWCFWGSKAVGWMGFEGGPLMVSAIVGKTSLITRFMYDSFDTAYQVWVQHGPVRS